MTNQDKSTKIGAGHASAMFRLGLSELRGAVYPDSNVAQPTEYGLYGTRTPGEVAESRRDVELDLEQERESTLADRMQQAAAREDRTQPTRELERD